MGKTITNESVLTFEWGWWEAALAARKRTLTDTIEIVRMCLVTMNRLEALIHQDLSRMSVARKKGTQEGMSPYLAEPPPLEFGWVLLSPDEARTAWVALDGARTGKPVVMGAEATEVLRKTMCALNPTDPACADPKI